MTDRTLDTYPADGKGLFFVEFSKWTGKPLEYRIFQRSFITPKYEFEKMLLAGGSEQERNWMRMSNEGHPYQLTAGLVNEHPGVICFETVDFLKFTVDSLNNNNAQKV